MTPDPDRTSDLFAELLELDPEARLERLAGERARDPDIAAELEGLLRAYRNSEAFLGSLATGEAFELLGEELEAGSEDESDAGRRVGPYRLGRILGRGGMGVVHLAEREEGGFEQRVAIKLVRRGLDRDAILSRFLAERQILARLEHPNVARLLDGGVAEDGRPYFALEYVDGEAITDWCDERKSGIDARLELFLRVCDAVRYAHSNLVVHRDLKPSNILVDAQGEPKLLDFGIAKLLEPDAEGAPQTLAGGTHAALTPEYAAPEQLRGEPVTTATDVYALGVVLYELLTGRRPHRIRMGAYGLVADPPPDQPRRRPSTVVGDLPEDIRPESVETRGPVALARRRASDPKRLSRRLAGDLDAIVLRALEPEPAARYGSAEALAADLRRHLEGRPIEARAASMLDRAKLFVQRHRFGVTAAGAVGLALAIGLALAAFQARRAEREARRAKAALGFLTEMLESADPSRSLGETVTARQLLDEGASRLRANPSLDPVVRAELADTLARTYRGLGQLDEAGSAAEEACAGFRRALGDGAPRTLGAETTAAEILADRGEVDAARHRLERILPLLRSSLGPAAPEVTRARVAYASVLGSAGEFQAALEEEKAILGIVRLQKGNDDPQTAERLGSLAGALMAVSEFDQAESALREALGILDRAGVVGSPQAAHLKTTLADLLDIVGRPEEADRYFLEALEGARATLGPDHPQVAETLIKHGAFLIGQGRSAEAEADLERAIDILEPIGHFDAGAALRYLGFLQLGAERFEQAKATFARAERILRAKLGDDHPLTWAAVVTTAYADGRMGHLDAAERRLREAIAALERLHGADANDVRVPRKYLGQILRLAGRPAEALELHRAMLAFERGMFGDDDNGAITASKEMLSEDLLALGGEANLAEARRLVDEALAFSRADQPTAPRTGRLLSLSGRIAAARGDLPRARAAFAESIPLLLSALPAGAPSIRAAERALAALGG